MKPNSGIKKLKSALIAVAAMAVLLFASENAFAQTHTDYRISVTQQPHWDQRWHAAPVVPHRQLRGPFASHRAVDPYRSNYGAYGYQYGFPQYGSFPGIYSGHYGYDGRPYVHWSPHFGWMHHSSRWH